MAWTLFSLELKEKVSQRKSYFRKEIDNIWKFWVRAAEIAVY